MDYCQYRICRTIWRHYFLRIANGSASQRSRFFNSALFSSGYTGYAYDRFTLELRYPLMLQGSTNIYALTFLEGGNAWTNLKDFNPFDMKRSAGVGVRIFLPMVGLLGIDWAYGFDEVFGSKTYSGSQFHFILGQEF